MSLRPAKGTRMRQPRWARCCNVSGSAYVKDCGRGTGRLTSQKRAVTTFPVKLGSLKGREKENLTV